MSANWGKHLQLSIFGESHQSAVGINIAGLPPVFTWMKPLCKPF